MNEVLIFGKRYTAPSEWDELSEKQFIAWAAACLKKMELSDNIRLFIKILYAIPLAAFLRIPESYKVQIAPTISFLWNGKLPERWVIKKLRIGLFHTFYGPDDRLSNCTINELRYALMFYQAYYKKPENGEEYLDQLIATLYRPKRRDTIVNDIRENLTDYSVQKRAKIMRRLSAKVRHAILLNFEGCYSLIKRAYLDKLPKEGKASEGLFDFNGIIRMVSGGKFGPKSQTEQTLIYDFLEHLVENAEESERLRSKS